MVVQLDDRSLPSTPGKGDSSNPIPIRPTCLQFWNTKLQGKYPWHQRPIIQKLCNRNLWFYDSRQNASEYDPRVINYNNKDWPQMVSNLSGSDLVTLLHQTSLPVWLNLFLSNGRRAVQLHFPLIVLRTNIKKMIPSGMANHPVLNYTFNKSVVCKSRQLESIESKLPDKIVLLFSERIVEDFEMSDAFLAPLNGGRYFLKVEEDAAKYEFLRRPQIVFKKEYVETPNVKRFNGYKRFEEAIEVKNSSLL